MFADSLGILIAFMTVILLFSLLVTAGVDAIHGIFSQRNYNLRIGMKQYVRDIATTARLSKFNEDQRDVILHALDKTIKNLVYQEPTSGISEKLDQPQEISIEELVNSVSALVTTNLTADEIQFLSTILQERFLTAQAIMSRRFQRVSNHLSLLLSLVVAIIYQLNTPQLLVELSSNKIYTESIVSASQEKFGGLKKLPTTASYEDVIDSAIKQLIEKNPSERENLEALSGDGVTNHDLAIKEFDRVIKGNPKAESLKTQYDTLLTAAEENEELRVKNQVANAKSDLAILNFKIIPHGMKYYFEYNRAKIFENYLGVLISAILISLGAPFWFNNLQRVFAIRDYFDIKKKSGA